MTTSLFGAVDGELRGIYGFCLFKQKSVVWANGSNDINVYGLKPHERLLGLQWAAGKQISKEEGANSL